MKLHAGHCLNTPLSSYYICVQIFFHIFICVLVCNSNNGLMYVLLNMMQGAICVMKGIP